MTSAGRFLAVISTLCMANSAAANQQVSPLYLANNNPFIQVFGLPKSEAGRLTPEGKLNIGAFYYVSNNAILGSSGSGEAITWDGETEQYTLTIRYGTFRNLELGLDLPYVRHSGGYLDTLIRQTHSIIGTPNKRQRNFAKNQIHYLVEESGDTLFELQQSQDGIGDLRLTAALALWQEGQTQGRYLALRPLIKLPTGDADALLGSGAMDLAMSLAYSDYQILKSIDTVVMAQAGLIYLGDGDVLPTKQRDLAGFGDISMAWLPIKDIELQLQLVMHSAFYDSGLKQLGAAFGLNVGALFHLPGATRIDLSMSQNLRTDATPDVGFYLSFRRYY